MALTLPAPREIDPASVPALRWGVIGTSIADAWVGAIHKHTAQRAVAVTARDPQKTQAFADRHGIPTVLPSVDALVNAHDVDAVYVATPHPLHLEGALAAIAAGKHVLVEKPIAMDAAEARQLFDAARAAGVLAMEAMWTRYLPQMDIMRQVIADGTIGDVHLVVADFGFVAPNDPSHRLRAPELGGGALLDAGVYPTSFASSVIGPVTLASTAGEWANGVDERASLTLTGAGGSVAQVSTSIVTAMPVDAAVVGSQGRIRFDSPFFAPSGITVIRGNFGAREEASWRDHHFDAMHEGLGYQATAFASYVAQGLLESPLHPHDEVVSIMSVIEQARATLRSA